jgi:4-amino-4-deoxy-L-arabinose transferase-like glycosyltransferase
MLDKLPIFSAIWQKIYRFWQIPYCSLLLWLFPLLLFSSGENSLMAHDEALYAWRGRMMFDSGDWVAPWGNPHHKTPGIYWLMASFYQLFGLSDTTARLPSMIAGILASIILYEIGKIILGEKVAWLASAILSVEFLWLQYCRLSTPDVPTILLVLLAILALLKAELHPKYSYFWSFVAGLSFSLGYLLRSFMIAVPIIALLPYLIGEHRRHRHLTNPMLYLGLFVGLMPTGIWLWFNWLRFQGDSVRRLFQFVVELGSEDRNNNGFLFYFWNLPLKSFPWGFFSLLGLVLMLRHPLPRYQLILVGFPIILFAEFSLFSTRLSHYILCIYPFVALLAAVGLNWLVKIYQIGFTQPIKGGINLFTKAYLPRNLSYASGLLGILLIIVSLVALAVGDISLRHYVSVSLTFGLGCLLLPLVWICRYHLGQKLITEKYWVAGWLIPYWLTLLMAGKVGLLGDYNPEFRVFFQKPAIAEILHHHPVAFAKFEDKNAILLEFYTPTLGKRVNSISELPAFSYVWISAPKSGDLSTPHQVIGSVGNFQLIQVLR